MRGKARKLRRSLLVAVSLLALQGCASLTGQVIQVAEEDSDHQIDLKTGQVLEVRLKTFPGRGLTLSLGSIVTPTLVLAGTPTHNDDTFMRGLAGTGSYEVWRFRAVQPGRVDLRMDYRLQWETTGAPTRSVNYSVAVQ